MSYRTEGLAADLFRALGAAVTVVPSGDIVPVMDHGRLDAAALNNPSSDLQLGLPDVAKFYLMGSHHRPAGALEIVFNKGKHDALPAEVRSILRHAALAASTSQLGMAYARYPKDLDEIGKRGVHVVRTGEGVLRAQLAAWDKVIAENSKEPFFAKVIASQKSWVRRIQPYLAANNLGSGELAAAYKHFIG
jgi:TRAP-type mannitol/chloroaromatic compound transport system substrate-binding protein